MDVDNEACDCMIHMLYRRCGGRAIFDTLGQHMAKQLRSETPIQTRISAVDAISAGLSGDADEEQQRQLALHLFAATIYAMKERQLQAEVAQAMAILTQGKAFEVKNLDDVLKVASEMTKTNGQKAN